MSCESNSDSYSSRYRQFSASSPDIHSTGNRQQNEDLKINYDLTSLNEINNQGKFAPNLSSIKFNGNKFGKFKLPQVFNSEFIYSSNNELFHKDSKWINGVTRYLKPILNYINKNPTKDSATKDNWEIDANELYDLEEIGRGNQGVVYCGIYRRRLVAAKKVKEKNETEIKHLKKLQHPNIINFIGITTTEPFYIVMEYCSKGQLYDALQNSDNVTRELFVDWSKQIVKGMRYLHDNQIVHFDLKSLNILINQDNVLKICDFGNSKNVNEIDAEPSFVGTCGWMSPEVIRNEKGSEKVDVWSWAVVFWELLFCERPYKNLNNQVITFGVAEKKLTLPIPSTCPIKYKNLMQICWNYEPKKRPDFNQILVDLKVANKEFLNTFTNEKFIEIKHKWKEEINENYAMKTKFWSSSDDENPVYNKRNNIKEFELQEKLQNVTDLLKKLKIREKQLKRKEKELGIRYDYKSNGLVNSLGRRLIKNVSKNQSSSLRLGKFVRNRSRRSYRLHYAQKQFNKTAETKDVEIQTNFFDFDEIESLSSNNNHKASDSGFGGESTSCLSTPNVKHKLIATDYFNSCLANYCENSNFENTHTSSSCRSSFSNRKQIESTTNSFHLHNVPSRATNDHHHSNNYSELPSGYLEAIFENSLKLKEDSNKNCKYRNQSPNNEVPNKSETKTDEKIEFSSDDETQDISVDSLNNNKYSEIYRPSSDSLSSSMSSVNFETNQKSNQFSTVAADKSKQSNDFKPETKRMIAINDAENESDESSCLTINNSYLVIPKSKTDKVNQATNQNYVENYIVLKTPTKDQTKRNVRDSLLLYKNRSLKKDEQQLFI